MCSSDLGKAAWLAKQVRKFKIGRRTVKAKLKEVPATPHGRALQCLIRNRTTRGGVLHESAGLLRDGEDNNGIASRWYPDTLAARIAAISGLQKHLHFHYGNGFDLIRQFVECKDAAFFVDPPYTFAARRLYRHWEIDHAQLFKLLESVAGTVLMTYDDTPEIRRLAAKHGFHVRTISMKTTHHQRKRELMIAKNFTWLA